jgi:hypothetical protein
VSNHAHRHPSVEWEPARKPGFFRRILGLGPPGPRSDPAPAVGYASSRIDAELMAGYLRSNGVHAMVSADDEGGLFPALQMNGRVRVLVPRGQHRNAHKLIKNGT